MFARPPVSTTSCDNVFVLKDPKAAMLLATPDCVGVEIRDNRFYGGNGSLSRAGARERWTGIGPFRGRRLGAASRAVDYGGSGAGW